MKTAVEIIETKIQADLIALYEGFLTFKEFMDNIDNYFNQAKQMEKEQLSDAWYAGDEDGAIHEFEQYYNETFKSE